MPIEPEAPARLVLVVEDDRLLGLEIEDALVDAGYRVGGPLTSCASALAWLAACRPDFAVVDARLEDGFCEALTRDLARRAVPFVVCSGWKDLAAYPALDAAPRLTKPVEIDALVGFVGRALPASEVTA